MRISIDKYPSYKDSGVEWLGEIPEYWKSERLASILYNVAERNRTDLPLLSITREKGVILRDLENEDENHNFIPDDLTNYKVLRKCQFGMNKMKAWQGSYGISEHDGIVSPAYFIFQLRDDIDSRYFHIAIRSRLYVSFFGSASDGVRIGQWDLSRDRMKNIPFLIPPLPEQTAIAAFLDRKTALIDQAIDIKQKQIELLKERRQILIHKAVTRGLNPNVKMKDSGNSTVGNIPEHWQINKLRNSLKPFSIKNHPHLPLLSITRELGVIERNIDDPEENHNFIPEDLSGYKLIKAGQFGMNKMKAWQGSYGISQFTGIVSPAYFVFDLISDIVPSFFHLAIRSKFYVPFFMQASDGVRIGQWDLSKERMKEIPIIIPPSDEQIQIVDFIERATDKILIAISAKEQEIEKLKEYKATLINSAVTGKLRVPSVQEIKVS
jgi:type I restriction enzyme, S subunit